MLRKTIDCLLFNVSSSQLFLIPALIHFRSQRSSCTVCRQRLKVLKTTPEKRAATLAIGAFIAHETVHHCPVCGGVYHSSQLRTLIPKHGNFGYDIIVFIGKSLFLRSHNYQQIRDELHRKNIRISESEIAYLAKKFILYLASVHRLVQRKTKRHMRMHGGYILHLDGTCDGASPHLISVLDGITKIVLDNAKLPSENKEDLIPFLESIKAAYGDPLAVVSDMGKGIAAAVRHVFPNVQIFICHYHFLKSVGKNLLGTDNDTIRERLREHTVRAVLVRTKRRLEQTISAGTTTLIDAMVTGIQGETLPADCSLSDIPVVAAYTLVSWVLDAESEGNGFGFPFDQSYLSFYQRLREAGLRLHELYRIQLHRDWRENKVYSNISHDLHRVLNDSVLSKAAQRMEEKVAVFNRLRKAMRITLPESKRGLNDTGEPAPTMKTIEKEVDKFSAWLSKNRTYSKQKTYQKLMEQIGTYREKLFADPIVVKTAAGTILIQPQRTNNILEQFFRKLMRGYRKKNGFNSVENVLKTMLPDTPLAMNLKNSEYMQILLAGKTTLEQRFAEVDATEIRRKLAESRNRMSSVHPQLKKLIRLPDLPQSIVSLLERTAS